MEVFSLLKFWRNASPDTTADDVNFSNDGVLTDDDEESFFDLVLPATSPPDCDAKKQNKNNFSSTVNIISDFHSDDDHYQFFSKSDGHNSKSKSNFLLDSHSDVFSMRKILPIESTSKPQSPISLLRSAPKLRVFMLGFSKSKLDKPVPQMSSQVDKSSKRFTVKYEVEEVQISSLLTRDNSLRNRLKNERFSNVSSKRFSKDLVHKYLNLIKPFYVKVSKSNGEKGKFSDQSSSTVTPLCSPANMSSFSSPRKQVEEKQGRRNGAVFREVCKHLGKSRSASSAVRTVPSPAVRRDDSVLQQQDGIQSAILHCKRSYNSLSSQGFSVLSRSGSAPPQGTSTDQKPRISIEEKRSSI